MAEPILSKEAITAAGRHQELAAAHARADQAVGQAEADFQAGGGPSPERLARNWAEAAYEAGRAYERLESAEGEFLGELERCGLDQKVAGYWHPRHILAMREGDSIEGNPGPVPA